MIYALIILGLFGLWIGSELVVRGAKNIAEHFRISELFLGLTILATGTNLPEIFVIVSSSLERIQGLETSGIGLGNVIGSSFAAVLIIGIVGLVGSLILRADEKRREGTMIVVSLLLLTLISLDQSISQIEGLILILVYATYLFSVLSEESMFSKLKHSSRFYPVWDALSVLGGLLILGYSAELTVSHSVHLSTQLGIPQSVIGILVVGLGTSLPELTTSVVAVKNKSSALAIGNLFGSTILNLLLVLGIGATISGFVVETNILLIDLPALLFAFLFLIGSFREHKPLRRRSAAAAILLFLLYVTFRIASCINVACPAF